MDWGDKLLAYDKIYPVPLFLAQGSKDRLVALALSSGAEHKNRTNHTNP